VRSCSRHQAKSDKTDKRLIVPERVNIVVTKDELVKLQKEDEGLSAVWKKLDEQNQIQDLQGKDKMFEVRKNLLYQRFEMKEQEKWQLVVPTTLREKVLRLALAIMSGYQGICCTCSRVETSFWWPGIYGDVTRFVHSCDACQLCVAKGHPAKVPLASMPIIDRHSLSKSRH
jgi:hypothetical protein